MTFLTRRQERSIVVTCATIKASPAPMTPELRTMDALAITHPMAQIKHPTQTQHTARVAGRAGHVALAMVLAGSVLGHTPAFAQAQTLAQAHASSANLTTLSLEQLLEVSIVGASKYEQKQSEVAAAVSVITRQEIKSYGWRTLGQALASLPGVHTTYDRQYTYLGTRGFGLPGDYNTRVLVTINGNRMNDLTFDQGPVGRDFILDMDLVERIEFIPGPGGAVFGQNAMFGVVNVVTRSAASLGGTELSLAYQSPQTVKEGRASWGTVLDNGVNALISVAGMQARGEDPFFTYGASGVTGVATGLDSERDRELFAQISGGPWSFELVHGNRRKADPTSVSRSDPLVAGQYQGDRLTTAQVQFKSSFAQDKVEALARLFAGHHRFSSLLAYQTPFAFPAVSTWRGAEVQALSTAFAGHKLMVGQEL